MRPKYPAETTNFTGHPKWQCDRSNLNAKTKNEFVFLNSLLKTINEKGIRYPFFVRKFENEKLIRYPFFVRKFENETGKNGIYTDRE